MLRYANRIETSNQSQGIGYCAVIDLLCYGKVLQFIVYEVYMYVLALTFYCQQSIRQARFLEIRSNTLSLS
mgnify:CR=1 FL=1